MDDGCSGGQRVCRRWRPDLAAAGVVAGVSVGVAAVHDVVGVTGCGQRAVDGIAKGVQADERDAGVVAAALDMAERIGLTTLSLQEQPAAASALMSRYCRAALLIVLAGVPTAIPIAGFIVLWKIGRPYSPIHVCEVLGHRFKIAVGSDFPDQFRPRSKKRSRLIAMRPGHHK